MSATCLKSDSAQQILEVPSGHSDIPNTIKLYLRFALDCRDSVKVALRFVKLGAVEVLSSVWGDWLLQVVPVGSLGLSESWLSCVVFDSVEQSI